MAPITFTPPRNRHYRTFMRMPVDRVPDAEFGCWPQTVRRWVAEGFPKDWAQEIGESMFHHRFEEFIGTDAGQKLEGGSHIPINTGMHPPFEHKVLSDDGDTQVVRDAGGIIARWYKAGGADASIPEYLEYPVKDRASWEDMKRRYPIGDPIYRMKPEAIDAARKAARDGWMISAFACGFYGQLRNWVGVENISYLFYDDPQLVHEMCELWAQLIISQIRQVPDDVPIHWFSWWEDMCFNHGPLCSVQQFHEFMVPRYKAVMSEARRHGCELSSVDSDGLIHPLVPGWLEAGINIMFPNEVAAGTDMFWLREKFGPEVRLQGGIDKTRIAQGPEAIDRELDRIAPLLKQGAYVPLLDHLVPPDISLADYMYYRAAKKALIGKR